MQTFPIDVGRLGVALCVVAPEPRTNRDTGEIRKNRDGFPLYVVGVSVRQAEGRRADVIDVVVAGDPPPITEGTRVKITDLTAIQWQIDGRSGTSFRASAIEPTTPAAASASSGSSGRVKSGGDA